MNANYIILRVFDAKRIKIKILIVNLRCNIYNSNAIYSLYTSYKGTFHLFIFCLNIIKEK